MADHLLTELKDRVLYLTMNRPDKLNAMSAEMMGGLVDNLTRAATNPEIGAVVLTGAGADSAPAEISARCASATRVRAQRARRRRSRISSRDCGAAKRRR